MLFLDQNVFSLPSHYEMKKSIQKDIPQTEPNYYVQLQVVVEETRNISKC